MPELIDQSSGHAVTLDVHGGEMAIRETQDTQPILDLTSSLRSAIGSKATKNGNYLAASVPSVLHFKWVKEFKSQNGGQYSTREFAKFVKQKLNDPEFKYFRVWEGRV